MVLTDRDTQLLAALHAHGFLTAELIELAFFPGSREGGGSLPSCRSAVYERLRQLWLWGFVDRIERPVARVLGGSRPLLYCLGWRGVSPVAAQLAQSAAPVRRRRLDRLDHQFIEHDLKVALLWAHLAAALRGASGGAGVRRWYWTAERDLRARHIRVIDPRSGRRLPFLPDGYFEIEYDGHSGTPGTGEAPDTSDTVNTVDGRRQAPGTAARARREGQRPVQACVVEIDMGSLTLRRFRSKIRAFELALMHGAFPGTWRRADFEVLVLAPSARRLGHLWQVAREHVTEERWRWYSFATFDVLQAHRFGDYAWQTLDGQQVRLLYDQAFRGEEAEQPAESG
jgi:hypothetical protein